MAQDMGFNQAMSGASRTAQLGLFVLAGGSVMGAIGLAVDLKTALIVGAGFVRKRVTAGMSSLCAG